MKVDNQLVTSHSLVPENKFPTHRGTAIGQFGQDSLDRPIWLNTARMIPKIQPSKLASLPMHLTFLGIVDLAVFTHVYIINLNPFTCF